MLAGIVIFVLVAAGLGLGLPWLSSHRDVPDELDGDPGDRFSPSMRIMHREVVVQAESQDLAEVSTPLTRRAELTELRMHAAAAARRRGRVALALVAAGIALCGLSLADIVPLWSAAIPCSLLVVFLVVARFSVSSMRSALDARAERVRAGYGDEDTAVIDLGRDEESLEISVDLSAPRHVGALWDPIPVTAPTYVSKPLVPRTVRTIDLSAPLAAAPPMVPTADHPDSTVEDEEFEETGRSNIRQLQTRAVGD